MAIGLVASVSASAGADEALPPSQWPATGSLSVRLEAWPNAVRYSGSDRYQTNLAVALGLRGRGDYPFDTPDRSSNGAVALSTASDWWGAGICPRAVIVVTGDNPADSLGASALSDPTHQSLEPLLQRTAAADPLFDPVGGFARIDTDSAPILITASARSGAVSLSPATRIAANDLRRGGCTLARQAIVVGGTSAVPAGVDAELLSLGYREVFRVAGSDRYDTAARIAQSLGTSPAPNGILSCLDPDTTDGATRQPFYANAVVELRESATSCRLLSRTVVIADGLTGADALAAGWWTSFWQVPVLLHNGTGSLPQATVDALLTMAVSNVIVLGGTSRISSEVATEAKNLAGATELVRLAGADRYDTSVQMAQRLGGWWPTGNAADFD
ncbi:MAG: cell wall-binding repeat-containing protein, partial [Ilumatobacteraceae bacterium]